MHVETLSQPRLLRHRPPRGILCWRRGISQKVFKEDGRAGLLDDAVEGLAAHRAAGHGGPHIALKALAVRLEIFGGVLVERVGSVGLEEEKLWSNVLAFDFST